MNKYEKALINIQNRANDTNCKLHRDNYDIYCSRCGQKLDWS